MSTEPPVPFYVGGRRYHACADLMQQPRYKRPPKPPKDWRPMYVLILLAMFLVALLYLRARFQS